jgi:hypothetical protein
MRGRFADSICERHADGFGENQAVGALQVLLHAPGMDLQAAQRSRQVMERTGSQADYFR